MVYDSMGTLTNLKRAIDHHHLMRSLLLIAVWGIINHVNGFTRHFIPATGIAKHGLQSKQITTISKQKTVMKYSSILKATADDTELDVGPALSDRKRALVEGFVQKMGG